LTLLVIYLSSWEEQLAPDLTVRRAWKGYLFEVLDALEEKGYISQTRRAKSLTLTEQGERWAQELVARHTI
jgi:DNA-binding PadR family transcriptional regulator